MTASISCMICNVEIKAHLESDDDYAVELTCNDIFHNSCLENHVSKFHNCPICKKAVLLKLPLSNLHKNAAHLLAALLIVVAAAGPFFLFNSEKTDFCRNLFLWLGSAGAGIIILKDLVERRRNQDSVLIKKSA